MDFVKSHISQDLVASYKRQHVWTPAQMDKHHEPKSTKALFDLKKTKTKKSNGRSRKSNRTR